VSPGYSPDAVHVREDQYELCEFTAALKHRGTHELIPQAEGYWHWFYLIQPSPGPVGSLHHLIFII
jgi:hypothetical protein